MRDFPTRLFHRRRKGLSPERLWTIFAYLPRPLEVWGVDTEWVVLHFDHVRGVVEKVDPRRLHVAPHRSLGSA